MHDSECIPKKRGQLILSLYQIRFLDTDLLPASSPEDYPKIIKSGVDEEHQHHNSPNVTGPSGIATLLHKIGIQQLLERFFDTTGTEKFDLRISMNADLYLDLYVKRCGLNVEVSIIPADVYSSLYYLTIYIL